MDLSHDMCYKAIKSRDARFDGIFFTAVKTTGIYCRPICRVSVPKTENCTFFSTAAEAESNGYRPCLRCRPELAPGYSEFEQSSELLSMCLQYFEENNYQPGSIGKGADYLGITPRHLSRVFQKNLGVSPQSYIMTKRLLIAKSLLTDTSLNITEIALLSGFRSLSRFNYSFKKHYGLVPMSLRKSNKEKTLKEDFLKIKLSYRPPYNWELMLQFYKMRTIPGVDFVTDSGIYMRTLQISHQDKIYLGWIEIEPKPIYNLVQVKISRSLEKILPIVINQVRIAFDLDAMPNLLHPGLPSGIRLPGCFDGFEMSTRAILGQQITVKAARTLTSRLVNLLGIKADTPWPEINCYFPTAKQIVDITEPINEVLGPLGIIKNRSISILELANEINSGHIKLKVPANAKYEKEKLLKIKGIGPWTAEYLAMRGLSWPDAFPVSDIGIKNALAPILTDEDGNLVMANIMGLSKHMLNKKYEEYALKYAEKFRPWRSYLTIALWNSLLEI